MRENDTNKTIISEEKGEIFKINPEIQKFNITGFNLGFFNKNSNEKKIDFEQNIDETKIKENQRKISYEILEKKILESNSNDFTLNFNQTLRSLISKYNNDINQAVSDYIFKKLYLMEYFHCFR